MPHKPAPFDPADRPDPPAFQELSEVQRKPGNHLRAIHNQFRRNMDVLSALIVRARDGDLPPSDIADLAAQLPLVQNMRMFGNLCGQHCQIMTFHHQIEDQAIFPHLAAKSETMKKIVERLELEHRVVHDHLEAMLACLADLAREPSPQNLAAAEQTFRALETLLRSHFDYEERAIADALGVYGIDI